MASVLSEVDKAQEADDSFVNAFNWVKLELLKALAANSLAISED